MKIKAIIKAVMKFLKNKWVQRVYLGAMFVFLGIVFYKYKGEITGIIEKSNLKIIPFVLAATLSSILWYAYSHYSLYRAMGVSISYWQTFQVIAFAHLGNYVPGRMWFLTNYYLVSRRFNIPVDKIGKNFIINNALLFFTGALCSLLVVLQLPFLAQEFLVILPVCMLILIHPKILNKIFGFLLPKVSQFSAGGGNRNDSGLSKDMGLTYAAYIKFIVFYFVLWSFNGLILYSSIFTFTPVSIGDFPEVLGASAASLIMGLLAVFAPIGLGVREGVGMVLLSRLIPLEVVAIAFVLLRLARLTVDLLFGVIAAVPFFVEKGIIKGMRSLSKEQPAGSGVSSQARAPAFSHHEKPLMSVIVPSYKSEKTIFTCIDSFLGQKTSVSYEVIVVDSSPGALFRKIEARYPGIKVIHRQERMYPGAARNIGIENAAGDIFLFLDADVIAEEELIEKIVREMDTGKEILGIAIDVANPSSLVGWGQYLIELYEFLPESPAGVRMNLPTGCLAVKKGLLDAFGGFPQEDIFAEDFLLTVKLQKNNIALHFAPHIRVKHFNKDSFMGVLNTLYYLGEGGMLTRKLYRLRGNIIVTFPLLIPLSGLYKYFIIFTKLLKCSHRKLFIYVALTPLMIINIAAYTCGLLGGWFVKLGSVRMSEKI